MITGLYSDRALAAVQDRIDKPAPPAPPERKFSVWNDIVGPVTAPFRAAGEAIYQRTAGAFEVMDAYGQVTAATDPMIGLMAPDDAKQRLKQGQSEAQARFATEGLSFNNETGAALRNIGRWNQPDPATANTAEQLLYGFARAAAKITTDAVVAGPLGVMVGSSLDEGLSVADDLRDKGVPMQARIQAGVVQGGFAAAAALPVVGETLKQTAALFVIGGPGGFMAQQALTRHILENAGQHEIAAQYDPFDPVGLAVSTLLPAGFSAYGLRAQRIERAMPEWQRPGPATDPAQAPMTAVADAVSRYAEVPREAVDAAMVMNLSAQARHFDEPIERAQREAGFIPVRERVLADLNAAGRFDAETNAAYADMMGRFYETTARRAGMTVEQLYREFPLRVGAEAPAGAELLGTTHQVGGKDPHTVTFTRREDDGRLTRVIEYPDGQRTEEMLVTDKNGDEHWVSNDRYQRGEWYPVKTSEESAKAIAREELGADAPNDAAALAQAVDTPAFRSWFGDPNDPSILNQQARGSFTPTQNLITLLKDADRSTFLHESGHFYLQVLGDLASRPNAPASIVEDMATVLKWMGVEPGARVEGSAPDASGPLTQASIETVQRDIPPGATALESWQAMSLDQQRAFHEQFARGFEAYLMEGKAPTQEMAGLFARFKDWLIGVYRSLRALDVELTNDVREVFDRLLTDDHASIAVTRAFRESGEAGMNAAIAEQWQKMATDSTDLAPVAVVADDLRSLAAGAGWAVQGGSIIRSGISEAGDQGMGGMVVGRTPWIPASEWYGRMRSDLQRAGLTKPEDIAAAVEKAIAGEKLNAKEERTVQWMRQEVGQLRSRLFMLDDADEVASDAFAAGLGRNDASDLQLTAHAAEINPDAVERAALRFENDDAGFRAEMERILRGEQTRTDAEAAAAAAKPSPSLEAGGPGAREAAAASGQSVADPNRSGIVTMPDGTIARVRDLDAEIKAHRKSEAVLNRLLECLAS